MLVFQIILVILSLILSTLGLIISYKKIKDHKQSSIDRKLKYMTCYSLVIGAVYATTIYLAIVILV